MTPEEMRNLEPGDKIHLRLPAVVKVKKVSWDAVGIFPLHIWVEGSGWPEDYMADGRYRPYPPHHHMDIISIEKTGKIPDGFIPWHGGECPVERGAKVETYQRGGLQIRDRAGAFWWDHRYSPGDIIAYRLVTPPKQSGELWAVVWPDRSVSIRADKSIYGFASKTKPIAIISTGIKWAEGDGLELIEEKGDE